MAMLAQGGEFVSRAVPSAAWTGVAGSGFNAGFGNTPIDPPRTTAKPACRLLVPPNQFFTDALLVGVYAGANDGGSLVDNMGLQKVAFHFEGQVVDVPAPSFQTFADAGGNPVTYFGWWCWLRKPQGVSGHARLYIEAVPQDATMQRRVIGPFQFSPQDVLHDHVLEVAPSLPAVAGQRYQSLGAALTWLKTQAAQNPLVTITQGGIYNEANISTAYVGSGYCTIEATAPVTFAKPGPYTGDGSASWWRMNYNRLRLRGSNITFDMRFIGEIRQETTIAGQYWLDGVTFTNSVNSRYHLLRKNRRALGHLVSGSPWFTECTFQYLPDVGNLASLIRGCTATVGYNDFAGDALCVVGNRVDDWDATDGWLTDVDAMRVAYTGAEATATLALNGNQGSSTRTFTATWGANTANFNVQGSAAAWTTGTNYHVQNVVNWLNSLPGWTATVIDDTRQAVRMGLPGQKGIAFTRDVKTVPATFVTVFDLHGDFYQSRFGGPSENIVIADNLVTNTRGQCLFISTLDYEKDYLVINNAWHNKSGDTMYASAEFTASQLSRSGGSHIVIAHNSWATQQFNFRTDDAEFAVDAYTIFANNTVPRIAWGAGLPSAAVIIRNNHLQQENVGMLPFATGTTFGGDPLSLFSDAEGGDPTPRGMLASALSQPVVAHDRVGRRRRSLDAAGAHSLAQ